MINMEELFSLWVLFSIAVMFLWGIDLPELWKKEDSYG